jgi:Uma2 family endonuclease
MPTITRLSQLDMNATYSYADYLIWKLKERVELIKGKVMAMSPAPNRYHQKVSGNLYGKLFNSFDNHPCDLYSAPFDVRLLDKKKSTTDKEVYTVVQPDLCVICDKSKLDDRGAFGAPDLVVEILSPGNSKKEMGIKFELYEEAGVKEYWIVEPNQKMVIVYQLVKGRYQNHKPLIEDEKIISPLFPELDFKVKEIFKEE